MKYLLFVLLLLPIRSLYAQAEKSAEYYYNLGMQKENDPELKKKKRGFIEAFPDYYKAMELAERGSELKLKATYKSVYLYNYSEVEQRPIITRNTIDGLRSLRKFHAKDSFAADYYFRAGLAFLRDLKPDSAIYIFGEAKSIYELLMGDKSDKVSDCYHGIGDVYKEVLYDFNMAETYYEKALLIRENTIDNPENRFLIFKLYAELTAVNKSQHDYQKALAYSLKPLPFAGTISTGGFHHNQEMAYTRAADIYAELGSFDEAENLYLKAIALNEKFNSTKSDPFLGDHSYGLAHVYQRAGKLKQAVFYYLKAIATYKSVSGPKNLFHIKSYQRLAEIYLALHEMNQSQVYFRKGVTMLSKLSLQKSGQASELYRSIGDYFVVSQKLDSALVYYQYSLISASKKFSSLKFSDNPERNDLLLDDFAYEALLSKATLLSNQYDKTSVIQYAEVAMNSFDLAEELLLNSRAKLDMDNAKWVFFDANFGLYEQALSLLFKLQNRYPANSSSLVERAFYYMESSKSKMLTDALNEAEFARPTSDSLIQFLNLQRRNLYHLQNQFRIQEGDTVSQSNLRNSIVAVDRSIQRTENEIREKYPTYINTKYQHFNPSLDRLKALSDTKKTSIIEYFWGHENVFGLVINGSRVEFKKLGSTDSIQHYIRIVHDILSSDSYSYDASHVTIFEENAFRLCELLVYPFEEIINKEDRLIILPDGPIEQIPFETLITKRTGRDKKNFSALNYLLKKHTISYSFSSLYLLKQNGDNLSNLQMLAFGFTNGERFRSVGGLSVASKNALPGSEVELKTISKEFPDGEYYFGKDVTEAKFKEKAPEFDLIHLAVHGLGDTEQNYSASLFFRDSIDSKEDGRLHWYELFGLRLKAKLAVISSCESGIGKSYRGEGMLSMANAFAFAGCKNIVMGLWKVDDRVSADLMGLFYENLRSGDPVDVALAKAKRNYIENGDDLTTSPKLWASLVSYGNEQVVREDEWFIKNKLILLFLSTSILLLLCFLFIRRKHRSN